MSVASFAFSGFVTILGVLCMSKGADWLTDSLVPLARRMGVSRIAVGVILVSAAVSLPEVLVAVYTAFRGFPGISMGTVLGSIICNIGLMTGLCAMIRPLRVKTDLILRDGIFSVVVPILVFAVGAEGSISRLEGLAFVLLFLPYTVNVFLQERRESAERHHEEAEEIALSLTFTGIDMGKLRPGWLSFSLGVLFLLLGTHLFGGQLITIARHSGISEMIIGVTLGALGPSLPNILAAYKAARRGMGEVAVSETLGSNVFTLLVTLGLSALISPVTLDLQWLQVGLPALLIMSFLLFGFLITGRAISRFEGAVLFCGYLATVVFQVMW